MSNKDKDPLTRLKESATKAEWFVIENVALATGLLWRCHGQVLGRKCGEIVPEDQSCPKCHTTRK